MSRAGKLAAVNTPQEEITRVEKKLESLEEKIEKASGADRKKLHAKQVALRKKIQKLSKALPQEPESLELIRTTAQSALVNRRQALASLFGQDTNLSDIDSALEERVEHISKLLFQSHEGLNFTAYLQQAQLLEESLRIKILENIITRTDSKPELSPADYEDIQKHRALYEKLDGLTHNLVRDCAVDIPQANSSAMNSTDALRGTVDAMNRFLRTNAEHKAKFLDVFCEAPAANLDAIGKSATRYFDSFHKIEAYYRPISQFLQAKLDAREGRLAVQRSFRLARPAGQQKQALTAILDPLVAQNLLIEHGKSSFVEAMTVLAKEFHPNLDSLNLTNKLNEVCDSFQQRVIKMINSIDTKQAIVSEANITELHKLFPTEENQEVKQKLEKDIGLKDLVQELAAKGVDFGASDDPFALSIRDGLSFLFLNSDSVALL